MRSAMIRSRRLQRADDGGSNIAKAVMVEPTGIGVWPEGIHEDGPISAEAARAGCAGV